MNEDVKLQTRKPKNVRVLGTKASMEIQNAINYTQIILEKVDVLLNPFRTKEETDKAIAAIERAADKALICLLLVPRVEAEEAATIQMVDNGG